MSPIIVAAGRRRRLPSDLLSCRLRARTKGAHGLAEAAFRLDDRLVDRDAYRDLLVMLNGFYPPLERAIDETLGWQRHGFDQPHSGDLLSVDLDRLSRARGLPTGARPVLPRLASPAQAVGSLYVLEGSALGGQIVARRARAALGDDLPVAFFTNGGQQNVVEHWRAFQCSLDAFGGSAGDDEVEASVVGALATFEALTSWLDRAAARG